MSFPAPASKILSSELPTKVSLNFVPITFSTFSIVSLSLVFKSIPLFNDKSTLTPELLVKILSK